MKALENYLKFLTLLLLFGSFHASKLMIFYEDGKPLVPVIWRNGTDEVKFVAGFSCLMNCSSVGSQMAALNISGRVSLQSYCNGGMCGSMYGFTATVTVNQSVGGEWGILLTRSSDGLTLNGLISCGNTQLKPEINDVIYENDHTITWTTATASADNGWDDVTEGSNSFKRWTAVISCNATTSTSTPKTRTTPTTTTTAPMTTTTSMTTTMSQQSAATTTSPTTTRPISTTMAPLTTSMQTVATVEVDNNSSTSTPAPITVSNLTSLANSGVSNSMVIVIPAAAAGGLVLVIVIIVVIVVCRKKESADRENFKSLNHHENVNLDHSAIPVQSDDRFTYEEVATPLTKRQKPSRNSADEAEANSGEQPSNNEPDPAQLYAVVDKSQKPKVAAKPSLKREIEEYAVVRKSTKPQTPIVPTVEMVENDFYG